MNILVAVDGSHRSFLALQHATDLAERQHARLTILTPIVQPLGVCLLGLAEAGGIGCLSDPEQLAAEIARTACERIPLGLCVTSVLTRKPLRSGLLRQIKAGGHDLVVIGARGQPRHGSGRLDGVSRYVLRRSQVPVMIVRAAGVRDDHTTSSEWRRVTLARNRP